MKIKKIPLIVLIICFIVTYVSGYILNRTTRFIPICYLVIHISITFFITFYLYYLIKKDNINIKKLLKSKDKKNRNNKIIVISMLILFVIGIKKTTGSMIDLIIGAQELEIRNIELKQHTGRIGNTRYYLIGTKNDGRKIHIDLSFTVLNSNDNEEYLNNNKNIKVKYFKNNKIIYEIER